MRHYPNQSNERDAFKQGYEQGVRDAATGRTRQLCDSPRGRRPPVAKSDDSPYYHGYKAGAEDSSGWEPAFERYEGKHGHRPNPSTPAGNRYRYGGNDLDEHTSVWVSGGVPMTLETLHASREHAEALLRDWWGPGLLVRWREGTPGDYQQGEIEHDPLAHRRNGTYNVDLSLEMGHEPNGDPGTTRKLDKVGDRIYGLAYDVTYRQQWSQKWHTAKVYFRIDGRDGLYRVDRKVLPTEPWEAIDKGEGLRTVADARAYIRKWVDAVGQQGTLTPRMDRFARNASEQHTRIDIEYGAYYNGRNGWYPTVWEGGHQDRGGWSSFGRDRDEALQEAAALAQDSADRYVGDWDVRIQERMDSLRERLKEAPRGELVMTMIDGKEAVIRNQFGPKQLEKLTSEDVRRVAVY